MVWFFHPSRWIKHVLTGSSQWITGNNSPKTHMARGPHSLPHLVLQALWGAHTQSTIGHNPGKDHHSIAIAMTTNGSIPFAMPRPHQPAQSASECMKSALIALSATHFPFKITLHPPTVHVTSKDVCSTRADKFSTRISNASMVARAKGTITSA